VCGAPWFATLWVAGDQGAQHGADEDAENPEERMAEPHPCGEDVEDDVLRADEAFRWIAIEEKDASPIHPDQTLESEDGA
jgi:hypothetical protein